MVVMVLQPLGVLLMEVPPVEIMVVAPHWPEPSMVPPLWHHPWQRHTLVAIFPAAPPCLLVAAYPGSTTLWQCHSLAPRPSATQPQPVSPGATQRHLPPGATQHHLAPLGTTWRHLTPTSRGIPPGALPVMVVVVVLPTLNLPQQTLRKLMVD